MSLSRITVSMVHAFVLCCCLAGAGVAQDLRVIDGNGKGTSVTLAELDDMTQQAVTTSTIWTDGVATYSGVSLLALLKAQGIDAGAVKLVALNDYAVTIPIAELEEEVPILASRRDGAPMPVRDKGPYWLIYPFDASQDYQTETIYARSIWQVSEIRHLP
ncbi:oxidoreductase [Jannaschia pagri]|uniref:Oxidoreductase n=1 Tax=Jannaschia pagri TaxID=2829797 RepID=A0ABQ4NJP7_9RHOB|nr:MULTISPECIES: oxidoreductase [unclassified Jannaschia]GIT90808.1 oxidoreductase [Jannaschia sp. AI_61]GIT94640.1 oxidoreductase [Jannaschia sp. AI_62]